MNRVLDFKEINVLSIGNIVQYMSDVYSIYDMDDSLIYLCNVDLCNIGIPVSEIRPVLVSDMVMDVCDFVIESVPETIYIGDKLISVRTDYALNVNKFDIDFKISIVIDYDNNDPFLVNTFDKIDQGETKVKYLHQIQNIFKHYYNFELITLE